MVWNCVIFSLAYIHPTDDQQKQVTELVYELFSVLLFHAMRLEYGGWRVWVDSMAIAHSKVGGVLLFLNLKHIQKNFLMRLLAGRRTTVPLLPKKRYSSLTILQMSVWQHELLPRKWHHVSLSFVYSRWAKSEIHCFVDGYLVEAIDANWLVSTNDHFDRCFVGCGSQPNVNEAFSGQMAAVYLFSQAISPPLVTALLYLGVSYQSQFKHEAESNLPDTYRKVQMRLYDFLADDLFCVSTNNSLLSPASSIVR
ncbi:hypothetical protein niasHT_013756 [Heterodera trifolii]|uniref:DUF4704 domain-containing protein n=1 Tax=Heterodera trifolii TaxID=157864 RepID=A0ABD2L8T4_9BILA